MRGDASQDEINATIVTKIEIVLFYILHCNRFFVLYILLHMIVPNFIFITTLHNVSVFQNHMS